MNKISVREIVSESEMLGQYYLLNQLNNKLSGPDYKRMLKDMLVHGYRMAGAYEDNKCIGLSGFWISTKLYCDKYVEMDNVVIDKDHRSKGVGKILCDWIQKEAKKLGCRTVILDAYAENRDAHRFYYREGFVITGFHFTKKL